MKKINTCNDNIFALSTPVGGAIAVIRASGSGVLPVLREIFSGRIEHRQLNYGKITDRIEPDGGQGEERKENDTGALAVLDEAMAVYFRAPHSYTGEDMFELNLHGSYSVVSAVSRALTRRGMRLAEAGEFTKRAFLNGKMDSCSGGCGDGFDKCRNAARSECGVGAARGRIEQENRRN